MDPCLCPIDWQVCFRRDCPRAPVTVSRGYLRTLERQLAEFTSLHSSPLDGGETTVREGGDV